MGIIDSIKNNVAKSGTNKDKILYVKSDSKVRIRKEPNLNCETITYLNKDDDVKIYDRSDEMFEINNEEWYWYQVKTDNDITGWVYGKYLDIEK